MLGSNRSSRPRRKVLLKDVNTSIKCSQCSGYLIDATALVDCLHTFCRACILKHFEASGKACPTCNWDYRKRSYSILRPDVQLQTLVYKMVGGLHSKEKLRREEFYSSTGVRASSSCSDDSLLEDIPDHEPFISSTDSIDFFSPDDSISLSLEYYQTHLDTEVKRKDFIINGNSSSNSESAKENDNNENNKSVKDRGEVKLRDRRYLQCPAAVEMTHLQKFIRMKYGLSSEHKVDIIYQGEVLPSHLNLMDVAYSFDWSKVKPMRFFYRIFTLMKVQPIKIINTTSAHGAKQLQIVTTEVPPQESPPKEVVKSPVVSPTINKSPPEPLPPKKEEPIKKKQPEPIPPTKESKPKSPEYPSSDNTSKERLMAQLQLQPNRDVNGRRLVEPRKTPERSPEGCFLRELPEQDKEEIKRFAEKRDREWRMLAEKEKDDGGNPQHTNKKRKRSKHSKSDLTSSSSSSHKKRKIHAEITPSDEKHQDSMKLKLKVTQMNGHKHKHRSGSTSTVEESPPQPQVATKSTIDSSKQELLKLRGVRHKNISLNESVSKPAASSSTVEEVKKTPPQEPADAMPISTKLRSDFTYNKNASTTKDVSEQHEKQTFLKTFQSYTKEHHNSKPAEKIEPPAETEKVPLINNKTNNNLNSTINNQKLMERKLAILKQECTIETKRNLVVKPERKVSFGSTTEKLKIQSEKPKIVSNQFTTNPGFTVSKIDNSTQGVKRKQQQLDKPAQITDHRPSLEITAIPQPIFTKGNLTLCQQPAVKRPNVAVAKRPPPDTIPLDRIMKSNVVAMNKAGVSIRPTSETTTGVLDLSQKLTTIELAKANNNNGVVKQVVPITDNKGLSNLQMLSKVATEQVFSKPPPKLIRPQIPNLQSIHSFQPKPMPNLTKIPKLNEISPQFRNAQAIRSMVRPQIHQNQSIRNIPNPSLLVRQQHQNRMNINMAAADKAKPPLLLNNGCKDGQVGAKSLVVVVEVKEKEKGDGKS